MKMLRLIYTLAAMLCFMAASAADTKTVTGESTYYGDENTTPKQAMARALEQARIQALAKEFGTVVTGTEINESRVNEKGENTYYANLSKTDVRGEWVSDTDKPVYKISYDSDGNIVVYCRVRGLARKLENKFVNFETMILRNGADKRHADTHFNSGDEFRVYFKAPVDGYVAVYQIAEDRKAYTLLPYASSGEGSVKVKHGNEYIFFDRKFAEPSHGTVDEYNMMTDNITEHVTIYVLFSPKPFVKANDNYSGKSLPRSLPFNEFYSWLERNVKNDPSFSHKTMNLIISGKGE